MIDDSTPRPLVAASWRRCAAAGAERDEAALPPDRLADGALREYRDRHPPARLVPLFDSLLAQDAEAAECVYTLCDADGTLLRVRGHHGTRTLAERINFAEAT